MSGRTTLLTLFTNAGGRTRLLLGTVTAVVLLLFLAAVTTAQGPEQVRIEQINATQYPRMEAILEIVDDRGLPVLGITANQVRVFEDNTPASQVNLVPAQQAGIGIGVVLAIDISGSMAGAPLDAAKRAANLFIDQLSDIDRVAIVSFSSQVRAVQGFTNNKQEAKQRVNGLIAGGNTKLYEGLYHAADIAGETELPRKVIILLSDGRDTDSTRSLSEALNRALSRGIVVSTVGFGEADPAVLQQFADATGGRAFFTSSIEQLAEAYSLLAAQLRSAYRLTYTAPTQQGTTERTLRVEVTRDGRTISGQRAFRIDISPLTVRLVGISGVLESETVLRVEVDRPELVAHVVVLVDGQERARRTQQPFTFTLSPKDFAPGQHLLQARIRDVSGRERADEVQFTVLGPERGTTTTGARFSPWQLLQVGIQWAQERVFALLALVTLPASIAALIGHILDYRRGRPCVACGEPRPNGAPCRACQSRLYGQSLPLGQILVQAGVISGEQLNQALETSRTQGKRLGEVLTSARLITSDELRAALRIQDRTTALALRFQRLLLEREGPLPYRTGIVVYGAAAVVSLLLLVAPLFF